MISATNVHMGAISIIKIISISSTSQFEFMKRYFRFHPIDFSHQSIRPVIPLWTIARLTHSGKIEWVRDLKIYVKYIDS